MGEVYRARHPRLDRQVAIKLLPGELAADPHSRERLRREAMAVAGIDHPYICKIFEIGEHGDALFLLMEYIAGETLHRSRRADAASIAALMCGPSGCSGSKCWRAVVASKARMPRK
jgi:serine/threonine protein kinase